jgi:transcriptional regulator with XRE-family HTH domain
MQCSGQGGYVETLREFRRRRGWSQKDLADESGVGQDTISGIESGRHEPRPSTLRKLADALDVEVADFFREPALPLAEAPREAGQDEEEELTLAALNERVLRSINAAADQFLKATARTESSQGIPQRHFVHGETEIVDLLSREDSDVAAQVVAEVGVRLRLEVAERDLKIARLEAKVARLEQQGEEENVRMSGENAELRSEAERKATR